MIVYYLTPVEVEGFGKNAQPVRARNAAYQISERAAMRLLRADKGKFRQILKSDYHTDHALISGPFEID